MKHSLSRKNKKIINRLFRKYMLPYYFAHKPLCSRHKSGVFHIFSWYICRGCTMLYTGLLISVIIVFLVNSNTIADVVAVIFAGITIFSSLPVVYRKFPRILKDFFRLTAGIVFPFLFFELIRWSWLPAVIYAFCIMVVFLIYRKSRQKINMAGCHGCSQLDVRGVCDGYRLQAEAMKNMDQEAAVILMKDC